MPPGYFEVAHLLRAPNFVQARAGDPAAAEQLLPLVYEELRKLAAVRMIQDNPGQTLQPTALVHEAYLRLDDVDLAQQWNSRGHFFAAAAEAMRRILVERARQKKSLKQGGHWQRLDLSLDGIGDASEREDLLAIDAALNKLSIQNPAAAKMCDSRSTRHFGSGSALRCVTLR